jgi:hypothetical protein
MAWSIEMAIIISHTSSTARRRTSLWLSILPCPFFKTSGGKFGQLTREMELKLWDSNSDRIGKSIDFFVILPKSPRGISEY